MVCTFALVHILYHLKPERSVAAAAAAVEQEFILLYLMHTMCNLSMPYAYGL